MGRHPPCDALMESPDSALFEGIGSSVPWLYHRSDFFPMKPNCVPGVQLGTR